MSLKPCAVTLLLAGVCISVGRAEDFHIHSQLFVGGDKDPVSENTTLFRDGLVYDYLGEPANVTVFDAPRRRFILLDSARRVRTEIATADVERFTRKLHSMAAEHKEAFLRFQADPQFDEPDAKADELLFESPWLTYRVLTEKAPTQAAADQYGEFSDWYARLNAMLRPKLLPFARLRVNRVLREKGVLPKRVALTISDNARFLKPGEAVSLRTEHLVVWRLSRDDERRIEQTAKELATFKSIRWQEFRDDKADQVTKDR